MVAKKESEMLTDVRARNFILQDIDTKSLYLEDAAYMFLLIKADWCVHCKNYQPYFEEYSKQFQKAHFLVFESTYDDNAKLLEQWSHLAWPKVPTFNGSVEESPESPETPNYNPEKRLAFPTVVLYRGDGHPIAVVPNRLDLAGAVAMFVSESNN